VAPRGSARLPSTVELRLPGSEAEILAASRAIARDLDLAIRERPGGGLIAHARFPFFVLGAVAVGAAAGEGGTAVSIRQTRLGATTGAQNYYLRQLIRSFATRLEGMFAGTGVAVDRESAPGAAARSGSAPKPGLMWAIRVAQSLASLAGIALIVAGLVVAGGVGSSLAIGGVGLCFVVTSALETIKRRLLGTISRPDVYMLAGSVLLAAALAVLLAFLMPGS
jgi:hypothetical protein